MSEEIKKVKEELQEVEERQEEKQKAGEKSFAMELILNARNDAKRWFVIAMTVLFLWFATIGIFVWYIQLYDYSSTTYTSDSTDGGNAIINEGGDVNINGESQESNKNTD